jgi:subtilisin family serine protease
MWCGSGTSFSTPIAAGAVGLLRSAAPWLTAPQVVEIMIRSSKKAPTLEKKIRSGGVIDLVEALKMASHLRPVQ